MIPFTFNFGDSTTCIVKCQLVPFCPARTIPMFREIKNIFICCNSALKHWNFKFHENVIKIEEYHSRGGRSVQQTQNWSISNIIKPEWFSTTLRLSHTSNFQFYPCNLIFHKKEICLQHESNPWY